MSTTAPSARRPIADYRPTRSDLGALFGVTERWIGELRAQERLPADGATLAENVRAWVAYRLRGGGDN